MVKFEFSDKKPIEVNCQTDPKDPNKNSLGKWNPPNFAQFKDGKILENWLVLDTANTVRSWDEFYKVRKISVLHIYFIFLNL